MTSASDDPAALSGDCELTYYKVDTSRLTYAEIWRIVSDSVSAFLIVSIAKLLGRPMRQKTATAAGHQQFIDVDCVPAHIRKRLDPICREFEKVGLVPRFAVTVPQLGNQEGYAISSSHGDGTVMATALYARSGAVTEIVSALMTRLRDGRVISTTNSRKRLNAPPEFHPIYRPGTAVPQLIALHRKRLRELVDGDPLPLDERGRRQLVLDNAERSLEFQRARGVLVPVSPEEVERLRAKTPPAR